MPGPASKAVPWFASLGGALAWAAHLGLRYPLVPVACEAGTPWVLHTVTLGCSAVALAAFVVSVRLARLHAEPHTPARARIRFMAQAGLLLNPLFLMVILAELVPALMLGPCA